MPPRKRIEKNYRSKHRPPFECIALLLQGGGALGAYQGGVYQALSEANILPDWVAGISIGSINAAIIAGNAPSDRIQKLRQFWELLSTDPLAFPLSVESALAKGDMARTFINQMRAANVLMKGVPGFFTPRVPSPWFWPPGSTEATSYYDPQGLKSLLEGFVDFDRLNHDGMRFSICAVNIRSGNYVHFDNTTHTIKPEHIMASSALPPGFPPVEIEGEYYWDGGLVSNSPITKVLNAEPRMDTLAFQVDLWSARGNFPRAMPEVMTRMKEIQYSSRTRENTDRFKHNQKINHAIWKLLKKLPASEQNNAEVELLKSVSTPKAYKIIHLIYLAKNYEGLSKDYEFSRLTMEEHWQAGLNDTIRTLRHPEVLELPKQGYVSTFDVHVDGRE
jgi:NTE family protein